MGIRGDPVRRAPRAQAETRVCGRRGLQGRILLEVALKGVDEVHGLPVCVGLRVAGHVLAAWL